MIDIKWNYLLSILIPTKNREEYALQAISQVLMATNETVQIVVQDNSDSNSLYFKLKDIASFERIKYNHSIDTLSFVDNFSMAVSQSDGEYLCMIGDDDGINSEIVELISWAKEKNIEAIIPEIRLNYIWPNTGISYYKNDTGNLMIFDFSMKCNFYNTEDGINKLLEYGGQNYLKFNLVKIYHGIIKRSLLEKVKNITGKYFGGLSPDIYSSVALSLVVERVLRIDYPFTIPGVCSKSGSGQSSTGKHQGNLEDAPHFKGHYNYHWSELVPAFYSVETIWADSALAALSDMNREDLIQKFNVHMLTVYCFHKHKEFYNIIKSNYKNYCHLSKISFLYRIILLLFSFIKGPGLDFSKRVFLKIFRAHDAIEKFENVKNTIQVMSILSEYSKRKSKNINEIMHNLNQQNCFK